MRTFVIQGLSIAVALFIFFGLVVGERGVTLVILAVLLSAAAMFGVWVRMRYIDHR